jgi:hypothetical protein
MIQHASKTKFQKTIATQLPQFAITELYPDLRKRLNLRVGLSFLIEVSHWTAFGHLMWYYLHFNCPTTSIGVVLQTMILLS